MAGWDDFVAAQGGAGTSPPNEAEPSDWDAFAKAAAGGGGTDTEPSWGETFATAKQNVPTLKEYFLSNVPESMGGTFNAVRDVKNVGRLATGAYEYAAGAPPSPEQEQAKALGRHYLNYFSEKGLKENISQDPAGTLTDILSIATPAKLANFATKPITQATKAGLTAAGMKTVAGDVLDAAKSSGLHFTQPFTSQLARSLEQTASDFGYDASKHTRVASALKRADRMGEGLPSLQRIQFLRQDLNDALASNIPSERKIAFEMKRQLDTVFTDLGKGTPEQIQQVVHAPPGVDPVATLQNFKRGLTEYAAGAKASDIEHILDKAGVSGFNWTQSGFANAIKTEFRKLYKNDKKLRGYTPTEQQMIRDIASGRFSDHALTLVSKFAIRGPVTFAVGHLVGGGAVGHTLLAGTGELAKRAIDRRMVGKVERLRDYVLSQGDTGLRKLVGDQVYNHVNGTPQGSSAIRNYLANPGPKTQRALAVIIAQSTNQPYLAPLILKKLSEQGQ